MTFDPWKPYEPKMPPQDLDTAFAKRCLLITPDDVAGIAANVPDVLTR